MFAILINEKGGEQKRLDFDKPEVTIGRVQGNDIILPKGNVSKRHSRIVLKDGKFIIVDLKSTNGTYVNGRKITSPLVVKSTDKIYIGDFILSIEEAAASGDAPAAAVSAAPPPPPPPAARPAVPPPPPARKPQAPAIQDEPSGDLPGDEDSGLPAEEPPKRGPASAPLRPPSRVEPPLPAKPPVAEPQVKPTVATPMLNLPAEKPEPAERDSSPPRLAPVLAPLDQPVRADHVSEQPTRMAPAASMPIPAQMPTVTLPPAAGANLPTMEPIKSIPPPAEPAPKPAPVAPPPGRQTLTPAVTAPPADRGGLGSIRAPAVKPSIPAEPARPEPARPAPRPAPAARPQARPTAGLQQLQADEVARRRRVDLLSQIVPKAIDALGLQTLTAEHVADTGLSARVENAVGDLVDKLTPLPIGVEPDALTKEAVAEILGAGPLDDLLGDETVHEVAVTGHDRIFVERGATLTLSDKVFSSPAGVLRAVHRLALRAGAKLDGTLTELRLDGGALLQLSLPPHARVPSLVVRRSRKSGGRLQDLVDQKVLSAPMSELLELCMRERRNFIVSGYGRGVMLGALASATAAGARVVTVEPVSELDLSATTAAWIGLISRGTDARTVIGHAGRLHPDHLIITDVRGPEALDVAAALCGAQGVVVGVDAASARDAIARLESLGRLSGESPPRKALREELAQGLHLAVHVGKTAAGAYRVMEIAEVTLAEEGGLEMIPMFTFKPEGTDGQFVTTGHVPAFAG